MKIPGTLSFAKAEAAGNDFVIFDNRDRQLSPEWRGFVRWLCDRHFGVGADGVILVEESDKADLRYVHLNSDGTSAGMCGNGSRCLLRFAHEEMGLPGSLRFEIGGRVYSGEATPEGALVRMPFSPIVNPDPGVKNEADFRVVAFVDVGVPHLILQVDDVKACDLSSIAPRLRYHPAFPRGTNVDFVQILGPDIVAVRTYERGVEAETLACGTGAVATVAALHRAGLLAPVSEVQFPGGKVNVALRGEEVELSGPARIVFRGELRLERHPSEFGA